MPRRTSHRGPDRPARRVRRWVIAVALGVIVATAAALAAVAWHYSDMIVGHRSPSTLEEQRVLAARPDRIRLSRDAESLQPGTWALQWQHGYGWVGRVLESDATGVVREFH